MCLTSREADSLVNLPQIIGEELHRNHFKTGSRKEAWCGAHTWWKGVHHSSTNQQGDSRWTLRPRRSVFTIGRRRKCKSWPCNKSITIFSLSMILHKCSLLGTLKWQILSLCHRANQHCGPPAGVYKPSETVLGVMCDGSCALCHMSTSCCHPMSLFFISFLSDYQRGLGPCWK